MNLPRLCLANHNDKYLLSSAGHCLDVYGLGYFHRKLNRINIFSSCQDIYGVASTSSGAFVFGEHFLAFVKEAQFEIVLQLPVKQIKIEPEFIVALKPFSGNKLAILYQSNSVRLLDYSLPTDENCLVVINVLDIHPDYHNGITCGLFSGESWETCNCIVGTVMGEILVWNPALGTDIKMKASCHEGAVLKLYETPKFLYSISDDRSLRVWNRAPSPDLVRTMNVFKEQVRIRSNNGHQNSDWLDSFLNLKMHSKWVLTAHETRPFALYAVTRTATSDIVCTGSSDGMIFTFRLVETFGVEPTRNVRMLAQRQLGLGEIRSIINIGHSLWIGTKQGSLVECDFSVAEPSSFTREIMSGSVRKFANAGDNSIYHLGLDGTLYYNDVPMEEEHKFRYLVSSPRAIGLPVPYRAAVAWADKHYAVLQFTPGLKDKLSINVRYVPTAEKDVSIREAMAVHNYVLIDTADTLILHRADGSLHATIDTSSIDRRRGKHNPYTSFLVLDNYMYKDTKWYCLLFVGGNEGNIFTCLLPMSNERENGLVQGKLVEETFLSSSLSRNAIVDIALWHESMKKKLISILQKDVPYITVLDCSNNGPLQPHATWSWSLPIAFAFELPTLCHFINDFNTHSPYPVYVAGWKMNKFHVVNIMSGDVVLTLEGTGSSCNWSFSMFRKEDNGLYGSLKFLMNKKVLETSGRVCELQVRDRSIHSDNIFAVEKLYSTHYNPGSALLATISLDNSIALSRYDAKNNDLHFLHREIGPEPQYLALCVPADADRQFSPSPYILVGKSKAVLELYSIDFPRDFLLKLNGNSREIAFPPSPLSLTFSAERGPQEQFRVKAISSIMKKRVIVFTVAMGNGVIDIYWFDTNLIDAAKQRFRFLGRLPPDGLALYTQVSLQMDPIDLRSTVFAVSSSGHLHSWISDFDPWCRAIEKVAGNDKWYKCVDIEVEKAGLSALCVENTVWGRVSFVGSDSGKLSVCKNSKNGLAVYISHKCHSSTITGIQTAKKTSDLIFVLTLSVDCTLTLSTYSFMTNELTLMRQYVTNARDPGGLRWLSDLPNTRDVWGHMMNEEQQEGVSSKVAEGQRRRLVKAVIVGAGIEVLDIELEE